MHLDEPVRPDTKEANIWTWGGNQHALWALCPTCDLRVGYWPKKEHSGKYSLNLNPAVVAEALENIKRAGGECTSKRMKAEIELLDAQRRKTQAEAEAKPKSKASAARAKPKAKNTGPSASTASDIDMEEDAADRQSTAREMKATVEDLKRENKKLQQEAAAARSSAAGAAASSTPAAPGQRKNDPKPNGAGP